MQGKCLFKDISRPVHHVIEFASFYIRNESKKEGKEQKLIQSSTTPGPGQHMRK